MFDDAGSVSKPIYLKSASQEAILAEQFWYLMAHYERCHEFHCSDCQRFNTIRILLLVPFSERCEMTKVAEGE